MSPAPMHILTVDDEPELCIISKELLEISGNLKVDTAGTVQEAREAIAQHHYDAIVSDYQMPGEDGIQFLKSLRISGDKTPFILFTGRGREEVVVQAFDNGADAYLQKGGEASSLFVDLEHRIETIVRRHRAEAALLESNEELMVKGHRLTKLMEQSFDAIMTHRDGKIVQANDAACKLIGARSIEDHVGRPISEFAGPGSEHVIEERMQYLYDHPGYVAPLKEEKFRRLDGTIIDVEVMATSYLEDSKPTVQVVFRNITERKRMEMELRESEELHRHLMSSISVGFVIIDPVTRNIESVNDAAAAMFGSTKENIIGHRCHSFLCPALEGACPVCDKGNEVDNTERVMICADGSKRPVLKTVKRTMVQGREKLLECFLDITERKKAEEALRQVNSKLNLLSSITRHDINNQITALQGNLALLEIRQPHLASDEHLMKAEMAAGRISAMIQFTKEYEDIGVNAPLWQNIQKIVEKCVEEVPLGPIHFTNNIPSNIELYADPLIIKVFHNLIGNAVRHAGKITTLEFSLEEKDGVHAIVCQDDGVGISAEMKEKLFSKGSGKDHGFGLFLSREILAITGITITEEGEQGRGARFVLTLPKDGFRAN
jgi:PAS domain S-box-containing protein